MLLSPCSLGGNRAAAAPAAAAAAAAPGGPRSCYSSTGSVSAKNPGHATSYATARGVGVVCHASLSSLLQQITGEADQADAILGENVRGKMIRVCHKIEAFIAYFASNHSQTIYPYLGYFVWYRSVQYI